MPTRKRHWNPDDICHITARGNHRNDIFKDEEDFAYYLTLMKEAGQYFQNDGFEIVCYCLMDNHVHILLSTENVPEGELIGRMHSRYAKFFNKKYNYIGHLFQDRYFSETIKNDSQMLEVSKYIHLNPVRANMVKRPGEYKWSSFSMYIGEKEEEIISTSKILSYFKEENRRALYKLFVEGVIKIK